MATQSGGMFQDQNLNVHYDGAKTNVLKAQKKGGFGGRKALNDISNSTKNKKLQASKNVSSKNVISIGEDIGFSKSSFVGKTNVSKVKVQAGGRKALGDLTNSANSHVHWAVPKKINQDKKLSAVAEEQNFPSTIGEEQFLHNHQECIKAQRKVMDMDHFLKTVGLDTSPMQLANSPLAKKLKPESPPRYLDMEEMSEVLIEELFEERSPLKVKTPLLCGTPESPEPFMHWTDQSSPDFKLKETP